MDSKILERTIRLEILADRFDRAKKEFELASEEIQTFLEENKPENIAPSPK